MLGREATGVTAPASLHLQRHVTHIEASVEFVGNALKKRVSRMTLGHDQMRGHCILAGAHGPDMQIVRFDDARLREEILTDRLGVDPARYGLDGKTQ